MGPFHNSHYACNIHQLPGNDSVVLLHVVYNMMHSIKQIFSKRMVEFDPLREGGPLLLIKIDIDNQTKLCTVLPHVLPFDTGKWHTR